MKYLYENHLGGLYTSDEDLDFDELYCEACGDYDQCLGSFITIQEFWDLIGGECDINGSGGYSLQYIFPLIVSEFDLQEDVRYDNKYEKDCGFCCNTEDEIKSILSKYVIYNEEVITNEED